ncbi:hypothetical protein FGO68_gene9681 [Halteria grandinella]|uniref:Uncharacterized protein n=1 Tax=Halteria grandinella TaxID=5974 RepID=A0A8J8NEJ7_HALGN|nr:hypothetical protein FGO68_gene9681 [Halteria grandinella]
MTIHGFKKTASKPADDLKQTQGTIKSNNTPLRQNSSLQREESPGPMARQQSIKSEYLATGQDPFKATQAKTLLPAQGTGTSFYNSIQAQKLQEALQLEELQKQLVRIFGENTVISPNFQAEGDEGLRISKDSVDLITQMQQKPATPILRQRTLEQTKQLSITSPSQLIDILEQTHESASEKLALSIDQQNQQLANLKYQSSHGGEQSQQISSRPGTVLEEEFLTNRDDEDEDASEYAEEERKQREREIEEAEQKRIRPQRDESPSKLASFKQQSSVNEMQETLKLIQQVTSSILDKSAQPYKSKAHVTRIPKPQESSPNMSAKKGKLVIPRSAIQLPPKQQVAKPTQEKIEEEEDEDASEEDEPTEGNRLSNLDKILMNISQQKEKCMSLSWRLKTIHEERVGEDTEYITQKERNKINLGQVDSDEDEEEDDCIERSHTSRELEQF